MPLDPVSPLPIRQGSTIAHSPSNYITIDTDEDDVVVYGGDTIPCSPVANLGVRTAHTESTTQPTQVVDNPKLRVPDPIFFSSSPASAVEVPASSPVMQFAKKPKNLGSRLAPAGTRFQPPPRSSPSLPAKRAAPAEPVLLLSDDDEDDLTSPRGDIRPTSFKKQIASFSYDPAEERKQKEGLRQIWAIFGETYSPRLVKEALKACKNDADDAIIWLQDRDARDATTARAAAQRPSKPPSGRRLVSKGALRGQSRESSPIAVDSPAASPSPSTQQLPQPKRRLMQGLRKRAPSVSPRKPKSPPPPSSADPITIDLVDNNEDAYEAEKSPTPDVEGDEKVLKCVNESTLKELAAITGEKEQSLEPLTEKRPYKNLEQARRVSAPKKPGAKKSSRISIGEKAVDAIEVFLESISTIDRVVADCERKANLVKGEIETWDIDAFGRDRGLQEGSKDGILTPTSNKGLSRPPIPKQPGLMDSHCQMKPFQVFGLNWMSLLRRNGLGCILADEMGLGKTCQVISLISHLVESFEAQQRPGGVSHHPPWPNLIVVPPSTYDNWLAEFDKFAPDISIAKYRGSQSERADIAYEVEQNPDDFHVVLAPYSQFGKEEDIEAMRKLDLHAAIFDEGHKMKNPNTKLYGDLKRIPAIWKMLLTGTPVQNNLLEMVSLLSFINPKIFEGYMEQIRFMFSQKVTVRDVSNGAFLYSERVRRAKTILEPFILQRRKDQVVAEMPKKICSVVHCEMTALQKKTYDEYEAAFRMEASQRKATQTKGRHNDQNNIWMQLKKAAIHPLLFRHYFTDKMADQMGQILWDRLTRDEIGSTELRHLQAELKGCSDFELHLWCRDYPKLLGKFDYGGEREMDSGKVKRLLQLLAQYKANGDRALVFSKFSRIIEMLQEVFAMSDIDYRVITGSTKAEERFDLINDFNEDNSIPVFLLTTIAGGTGINLTSANKVIIFDQSDNPQDDIQAENRAHRLGQKKDVEVLRLISAGTIEELVHKACQKKIELANKVTGVSDESDETAEKNMEKEVRKMLMAEQMTPPQERGDSATR